MNNSIVRKPKAIPEHIADMIQSYIKEHPRKWLFVHEDGKYKGERFAANRSKGEWRLGSGWFNAALAKAFSQGEGAEKRKPPTYRDIRLSSVSYNEQIMGLDDDARATLAERG